MEKVVSVVCIMTLFTISGASSALCENAALHSGNRQAKTPSFEDLPVKEQFKGSPAAVRLSTREARRYRTVIREGAREGPNFAGHYTIVQWGCGAGCAQFAVVDAKTGAVFMPSFYVGPRAFVEGQSGEPDEPIQFRIDSRLLIVSGAPNEKSEGIYYYKWDGKRLALLSKTPFKRR
ncbi:MAG TPA: hypothetical protein VKF81_13445 [Blastocatellia bacterium]|nr:hypothetical protein [Blastocatellia bacterium]